MRRRGKGPTIQRAHELLARNYDRLRSELPSLDRRVGFLDSADIIQETAIVVLHDPRCCLIETDEDFCALFCYRYRMVAYQERMDYGSVRKKEQEYAYNQQAAETAEPEER